MHTRLLSFLTDVEKALAADDPAPSEGSWDNARTINYHLGLARLTLGVRLPAGSTEVRGTVLLQCYKLADGTPCLKAALTWTANPATVIRSIYSKPDVNWTSEARKIGAEWMAGPPAAPAVPAPVEVAVPIQSDIAAAS
ncbi:MAG TPA: hypothetical protein VHD32_02470 [Candidatus Didemnitutus sp.]|nr:hypothetical protein [Candidatus Didemnitutus sp.]